MTTHIPNLYRSTLHYASFCAIVNENDKKRASALVKPPVDIDCEVTAGKVKFRITLKTSIDSDKDVHIHVNVARLDFLDKEALPKERGSLADWQATLEKLHGLSLNLGLIGSYRLPWNKIPEDGLIRGLAGVSTDVGGQSLSLTGAEIAIQGAPYTKLTWSKNNGAVQGEIFARLDSILSESYLDEAANLLEKGLLRFVFEEMDR